MFVTIYTLLNFISFILICYSLQKQISVLYIVFNPPPVSIFHYIKIFFLHKHMPLIRLFNYLCDISICTFLQRRNIYVLLT